MSFHCVFIKTLNLPPALCIVLQFPCTPFFSLLSQSHANMYTTCTTTRSTTIHNLSNYMYAHAGFLSAFCPRGWGGKMRLYELLGGQVRIHVQSMWQTRGVWGHAPPGNVDFGPFIRHNLLESGTFSHKHNLPFIVSL